MSAPVTKDALSEARNETTCATSSGAAPRARAVPSMKAFRASGSILRVIAVSIRPGETVFTRTFRSASSAAMLFEKDATAALDAA